MIRIALALVMILPMALVAGAGDPGARAGKNTKNVTRTSIVDQANQTDVEAEDFQITSANTPYSFQKVEKLRKIKNLRITLTLDDGDTGQGDNDENELTLALDGIDTGLLLNGFRTSEEDTRTVSGKPDNEAQLRAALKDDGEWDATIIDSDPTDTNTIDGSSADQTTLVIKAKQKKKD